MSNIVRLVRGRFTQSFPPETTVYGKISYFLIIGLIISIFIPIHYTWSGLTLQNFGYFSDFLSISLYLSQIFGILFILNEVFRNIPRISGIYGYARVFTLWISLLAVYIFYAPSQLLPFIIYKYLVITCGLLVGYFVYKTDLWLKYEEKLIEWVILMGVINSLVAIAQFMLQHSIGFGILGESPISLNAAGVAKFVSHGTTYIRSYGLFPHPNVLGGAILIISLLNLYLINKTVHKVAKWVYSLSYILLVLAIFLTFSRGTILAFLGSLVCYIAFLLSTKLFSWRKMVIPLVGVSIILGLLSNFYGSRFTWNDQSIEHRAIFNSTGMDLVSSNWLLGTGPGTNLFHMKQRLAGVLPAVEIQPIHNFFLIFVSETGITGLLIISFLIFLIFKAIHNFLATEKGSMDSMLWRGTLACIMLSLAFLLNIDHYFYTIWPAYIFFCIIIALTAKELYKNKSTP